jgi:dTDP-glucose pyrophosphorylase
MKPLSLTTPKPMLPICNKPLIAILAGNMVEIGLNSVVIVVSPSNIVEMKNYFEANPLPQGIQLKFAIQEKPLGTAHALSQAEKHVKSENIIVIAGDNFISSESMNELIKNHLHAKPKISIGLKQVSETEITSLSSVLLNQEGFVSKIIEKPSKGEILSLLAAISAYIIEKDFFDILKKIPMSKRGEYEIPTAFELLLRENVKIKGITLSFWDHISTPDDLWRFNILECGKNSTDNSMSIPASTTIKNTVIGLKSTIWEYCNLENCLLLPRTHLPDNIKKRNSVFYTNSNNELEIHEVPTKYIRKYQWENIKMNI